MTSDLRIRTLADNSVPLRWESIPAAHADEHRGLLGQLLRRERDGITLTGVFDQDEVDRAVAHFASVDQLPHTFGALIGMSLGMVGPQEPDRGRYLDDAEHARAIYRDGFGFDPHERLAQRLAPMADGLELVAPSEDGREYNPGQVRIWDPGSAGLPAHVGNEFRRQLEHGAMRHLITTTQVTHHLSYFVVLQKPEVGGALSVYDLVWEEDEGDDADWANGLRDDERFADVPCTQFHPMPGDLILFGGGWRWHRVDPLSGSLQRITYGGFAAPSLDGRAIHFWA